MTFRGKQVLVDPAERRQRIADQIGRRDRVVTRPTRTGMYFSGNFFRLSTPMDLLRFTAFFGGGLNLREQCLRGGFELR
mgnify:CR=1 FL=1